MSQRIFLFVVASLSLAQGCSGTAGNSSMEVMSIQRADTSGLNRSMCDSFQLTAPMVKKYFERATPVDENSFAQEATILPCRYGGTLRIGSDTLNWQIVAGGAGYLYDGGTFNKRYICRGQCCDAVKGVC